MMDTPQFPEAFASVIGLGAPKRYFPIKNLNRAGSLTAFLIFLTGSILVFLYGLYSTYVAYQKHGPAMIADKLVWPVIIAFVLLLLGLAAGWSAYANWKRGIALYDQGFAVRDRKGILSWRWEDVAALTAAVTRHYTNGIFTGTTHLYTLYNRQNERLVLNDIYVKVEELAKAIEECIFPLLYVRAADQYNTGQMLIFGPVAVSKAGIQIGKKTYPWMKVKEVSVHQGTVKISRKDGGWFSGANAAAASIPNLRVLLAIIHQVVGVKTS
jgi:Tfp pilus assembly protein PilZ